VVVEVLLDVEVVLDDVDVRVVVAAAARLAAPVIPVGATVAATSRAPAVVSRPPLPPLQPAIPTTARSTEPSTGAPNWAPRTRHRTVLTIPRPASRSEHAPAACHPGAPVEPGPCHPGALSTRGPVDRHRHLRRPTEAETHPP